MTTIDVTRLHALLQGSLATPAERSTFEQVGCTFTDDGAMIASGLGVWVDYLESQLPAGRHIAVYRRTSSTQNVARGLVEQLGKSADGAVILADEQSTGRGRLGRTWIAPPGAALLMSRACAGDALRVDRLFLAAAVAVARAIEKVTTPPLAAQIKWPNDILVDGRKLAGILVESFTTSRGGPAAVVGIGVNVTTAPPLPTATSLQDCNRHVDRLRLAAALCHEIDIALAADEQSLLDHWRSRSTLLAQQVELVCDGRHISGEVIDLDPADGLIVRQNDGAMVHLPAQTTTFVH